MAVASSITGEGTYIYIYWCSAESIIFLKSTVYGLLARIYEHPSNYRAYYGYGDFSWDSEVE